MSEEIIYHNSYVHQQAFEGASYKYKESRKSLIAGEADLLAARELAFLQQRSAHAIRNNGYAKAARDKYITNLQDIKVRWLDSKGKNSKQMQSLWDEFAKDPTLDGYGNFSTLFSILHSSMFETGTSFGRLHIRRSNNTNRIPLKIQLIATQLHAITYMNLLNDQAIIKNGIKFVDTKPVSYYFYKGQTELKWGELQGQFNVQEVPAEEILHTFIRTEAGQWLGLPFLSSILISLYELDELTDATIARQKASQIVSWIIERSKPMALTAIGVPETITKRDEATNSTIEETLLKTEGTNVIYTNSNEKVSQTQSADIGSGLDTLLRIELQKIAASLGIPFHQLTGDTSGLNFSSIRAINVELRTRIELIIRYYVIPLFLEKITDKFYELSKLYYPKLKNITPFYQLPRQYGIDDLKDAQADLLEVQSGFATMQSKLDERQTSYEAIRADRESIKELGLDHLLSTESNTSIGQNTNTQANSNSSSN